MIEAINDVSNHLENLQSVVTILIEDMTDRGIENERLYTNILLLIRDNLEVSCNQLEKLIVNN